MGYGTFRTGAMDGTLPVPKKVRAAVNGGVERAFVEVFDLAQANVDKVAGTSNFCFRKPKGHVVLGIEVKATVSLTTTQLAFGIAGTAGKYGAAKAYGTTAKARVFWDEPSQTETILETEEDIIMTATVADLPGAGKIVVIMHTAAAG